MISSRSTKASYGLQALSSDSQRGYGNSLSALLGDPPAVSGTSTSTGDALNALSSALGSNVSQSSFDGIAGASAYGTNDFNLSFALNANISNTTTASTAVLDFVPNAFGSFQTFAFFDQGGLIAPPTPPDTTPPVVAITSSGGLTNQATQTISGTVDVADAGTTVSLYDNGGATLTTPPSPATVSLTPGTDTVVAPASGVTVLATAATLNAGDSLTGAAGTDVLELIGSGTFRVDQLASFTGFEKITLNNATNSSANLTLGGQPIEVDASGYLNLQTFSPSNWNGADVINGDASQPWPTTSLSFYSNWNYPQSPASYDLTSTTLSHVQGIYGNGDNLTLLVNNAAATNVQSFSGWGQNDRLVTASAALDLSHTKVSGFTVTSTNAQGTTFTVGDVGTAFQVAGGSGHDTLVAQGFSLTADQRATIFATNSIETITDQSGTYAPTPPSPMSIAAGATLELTSSSSAAIRFSDSTGTLKLDNSASFTGTVAGMTGQDTIDFVDIDFATVQQPAFSGNESGGTLIVTDGTHTANIALLGNYIASTFVASSDGHGGTAVVDPPAIQPPPLAQSHHA